MLRKNSLRSIREDVKESAPLASCSAKVLLLQFPEMEIYCQH